MSCAVREAARYTPLLSLLGPNMLPTLYSYRPVEQNIVGRDGLVGTSGRSRDRVPMGARFSARVHTGLGPNQPPVQAYRVSSWG